MKIELVAALGLFLSLYPALGAQDSGGLVQGKAWDFLAAAPPGWVMDRRSLRSRGIEGLFRKEGEPFSRAGLLLYVEPRAKAETNERKRPLRTQ